MALAEEHLGASGRRARCGPYPLWTDVGSPGTLALCERIVAQLDGVYQARFGAAPRGEPSEGIFLFSDVSSYRRFAAAAGRVRTGYAGYASTADGYVALYATRSTDELASTLGHELTHLVHRRALGPDLPPWLSEGLAEAIGDSATPSGIGSLEERAGSSTETERLRGAYGRSQVGDLQRLVALSRAEFDRGQVSFDYEQSASLARFLLRHPIRGGRFRSYLKRLAAREPYDPEALAETLGASWPAIESELVAWLRAG